MAAVDAGGGVSEAGLVAVPHPQQLLRPLVELVVADAVVVEVHQVEGLDGRLVVEEGRQQRRGADEVAGRNEDGVVRVLSAQVAHVRREVLDAAGRDAAAPGIDWWCRVPGRCPSRTRSGRRSWLRDRRPRAGRGSRSGRRIWMSVVLSGLASTAGTRHGEEHRDGNADGGNALEITETSHEGVLLGRWERRPRRAGNVVPDASAMHRPRSNRLNTMRPRRARFPVRVVTCAARLPPK